MAREFELKAQVERLSAEVRRPCFPMAITSRLTSSRGPFLFGLDWSVQPWHCLHPPALLTCFAPPMHTTFYPSGGQPAQGAWRPGQPAGGQGL